MTVMRKKNPPEPAGYSTEAAEDYDAIAQALRNDPGEWYLIHENKTSQGVGSRPLRNRGCETTTRRNGRGKGWDVYARFPKG